MHQDKTTQQHNASSRRFTNDIWLWRLLDDNLFLSAIQMSKQWILNANQSQSPLQTPLSKRKEYKMAASN